MSYIIHMDTEIVREFASSSYLKVAEYWEDIENLNKKVQNIPWEGVNSIIFTSLFRVLSKDLENSIEEICELLLKVTKEVDGWIAVDQRNAGHYSRINSGLETEGEIFLEKFLAPFTTIKSDIKRMGFNNWWKDLTYEERLDFIRKEHERIARSLGLDTVPILVEDIPGSAAGAYNPFFDSIRIDSDLLDDKNGYEIISIIAHETRHQYQHDCVVYYEQTGDAPEGINIDQVKNWKSNFDNYISLNDDPQGYRRQPVEKDAYAYGNNYEEEYLNSDHETQSGGGGW